MSYFKSQEIPYYKYSKNWNKGALIMIERGTDHKNDVGLYCNIIN